MMSEENNTFPKMIFSENGKPLPKVQRRFRSNTKALDVLKEHNLEGKVAVITGCNSGIGYETAKSLALHGCTVIFACRNQMTTDIKISELKNENLDAGSRCKFMKLDLSSLKLVQEFIVELKKSISHIDMLILNAGVFAMPYTVTVDGLEATFQICHVSHFYLTIELSSLLDHTSRVVILTSLGHKYAKLPTKNLTENDLSVPASKYGTVSAYSNAKLCNILFARQLAKNWAHRGISVFAVHPGNFIATNLARNWFVTRFLSTVMKPFTKSLEQGASTSIYCAVAPELVGYTGYYFDHCYFSEPDSIAKNDELAKSLWEITENILKNALQNVM